MLMLYWNSRVKSVLILYVYIYINIYVYMYTYIYTYIYVYIYWRSALKTMAPWGLNVEDCV